MKLENQKVTLEDIENNIKHKEVCKFITTEGKILRWGVITLQNGFAVTGNPSATVNPLNDNVELGEEIALNNAKQKIWELMGYELATKIKEKEGK